MWILAIDNFLGIDLIFSHLAPLIGLFVIHLASIHLGAFPGTSQFIIQLSAKPIMFSNCSDYCCICY